MILAKPIGQGISNVGRESISPVEGDVDSLTEDEVGDQIMVGGMISAELWKESHCRCKPRLVGGGGHDVTSP